MQIQDAAIGNTHIQHAAIEQAHIAEAAITYAHIAQACVEALTSGSLEAMTAKIQSLEASDIQTDTLAAALAAFTVITAGTATFDAATVQHLVAEALNLSFGVGDEVFINNLKVAYAQMVSAAIGNLCMEKSTLQIRQAVLNVHIVTAYSATLTIGYSYNTAWSNRKTLLTSKTGIVMGTKTGSKAIDLTEVIQAYCRDGQNGTLRLWAFGTGGSTSLSRIRGYNPSSSYQSQRPYFTLTYDDSKARIFTGGEWKSAVPYVYHNGVWTAANIQAFSNDAWK